MDSGQQVTVDGIDTNEHSSGDVRSNLCDIRSSMVFSKKDLGLVAGVTLVAVFLWMMYSAFATGNGSSVKGQVWDFNGEPLSQVVVKLHGTDLRGVTDSNGYFEISPVSPGLYYLVVENRSSGLSIPVDVGHNDTIELTEISLYSP
jgi:hypothetical protein